MSFRRQTGSRSGAAAVDFCRAEALPAERIDAARRTSGDRGIVVSETWRWATGDSSLSAAGGTEHPSPTNGEGRGGGLALASTVRGLCCFFGDATLDAGVLVPLPELLRLRLAR